MVQQMNNHGISPSAGNFCPNARPTHNFTPSALAAATYNTSLVLNRDKEFQPKFANTNYIILSQPQPDGPNMLSRTISQPKEAIVQSDKVQISPKVW